VIARLVRCLSLCLFAMLGALFCFGCRDAESPTTPVSRTKIEAEADEAVWFRDDTAAVGLDFVHEAGPVGRYFMPQIIGSGAALLDYDNDGRWDLYLVQNGGPNSPSRNKLYHQRADGRFEDVSAGSGLDIAGYGMGVAVGDIDNDGFVDVYVSQYGGGRLFRNRGNGTFEDITQSAGAALAGWGTSAGFFDYDRDGWLDLVVVNYIDYDSSTKCNGANGTRDYCHPKNFPGTAIRLLHNRGRDAAGRWLGFEDVTLAAGLAARGPGLGVLCADFNGDRWPDILVANDAKANHLWINRGNGTFAEEGTFRGLAFNISGAPQGNMGVTIGDVFGSGRFDVFITHLTEETHTLWHQESPGFFQDRTNTSGLAAPRWRGTGFGTILADFDLDGALDLAVVNGRVSSRVNSGPTANSEDAFWATYNERNQLFRNTGKGAFRDVSPSNGDFCSAPAVSRGLVWGDFDNDGRVDLVVTSVADPARFFRNVAPRRGHWLLVRARDPRLKRDAYGAVITVYAGNRRWVGFINPGQSYLCSGDPRAHFGLGDVSAIDRVRVDWPDGLSETFPDVKLDRVVELQRGKGRKVSP
jgi:enediyne biosynthesis protein E4